MNSTVVKIFAAIAVIALFFVFLLIAAFSGYLYYVSTGVKNPDAASIETSSTPRPKQQSSVAPGEITSVEFDESSHVSTASTALFFGKVNSLNNSLTSKSVIFYSDGAATKITAGERTVNGNKSYEGPKKYTASIGPAEFAVLALVLTKNDFMNEEDSREISSLPIKKVLIITYASGTKVIKTGNMGKDTPEITEILAVFRALEQKTAWKIQ
ncbi:MAG: hypothetical protein H7070_02405 [Saprospiraceae bacterium]|nr:hypothetical protein [Pyrinomonadaceae bacterium]